MNDTAYLHSIKTILSQAAISLACWSLSFGLLQLLLASLFIMFIFWLVYGCSITRSIIWSIANALFSLAPAATLGLTLIHFDIKWIPDNCNSIATYSPMLPALLYALLLLLMGILFHAHIYTSPKRSSRLVLVALLAAHTCAAILRARIIGAF